MTDVKCILNAIENGDHQAMPPLVYEELRLFANRKMSYKENYVL